MREIQAIATNYRGRHYRSRLEARWAAYFDLLGWPAEYEPIDLAGYIPDFILAFDDPVLVEVKPALSRTALEPYRSKIEQSGWAGEALLVGAVLLLENNKEQDEPSLGLLAERDGPDWIWGGVAAPGFCSSCRRLSFCNDIHSYRCRRCGASMVHDGSVADFVLHWREAGNAVQWKSGGPP